MIVETKAKASSYDEVPYRSYPYRQSHPERLATIATLFGMQPPMLERCRVLELGCSMGGNLIPVAEQFPESAFLGIDASQRQIAEGEATVRAMRLENITLAHRSILDIGPNDGEFDYIVCHGVYSWVPPEVQQKILQICRENLSASGVAYVSYNTYPGWHMRGMIRDMMLYRTRDCGKPTERVRQARALLDFLAQSVPGEDNPYGILLKKELNLLRDKDDSYLLHEHLEDHNSPLYFHEFMERAEAAGLQYLGEADFSVMSVRNFPPQVESMLQNVSTNLVQTEQYMDFVRNRMFRQTLLCHQDVRLDRSLSPERVLGLHVASWVRPEPAEVDVHSRAQTVFRGPSGVTTTSEPLVKAALLQLAESWPRSVPFVDLLAMARSRLNPEPVVVDTAGVTQDARRLADTMLRCYATTQVELSVRPSSFVLEVSERPLVGRVVRHMAESSNMVTNRRHETAHLNDLQRHVLRHLDGQRDQAALVAVLCQVVASGGLVVHEQGKAVADQQRVRDIVQQSLGPALSQLARMTLLLK